MNKDNNQRYQDTELKIQKAYASLAAQKGSEHITVSDICRTANLHRTTFYGHYSDIIELRDKMASTQLLEAIGPYLVGEKLDLYQITLAQLEFYYQYKGIVRKSLSSAESFDDAHRFGYSGIILSLNDTQKKALMEKLGFATPAELDYYLAFFDVGFYYLIRSWIMQGCPQPPEVIANIICKVIR